MSDKRRHSYNDPKNPNDTPPNSRLFVIGSKQLTEEDFREAFSKYGDIEEIWLVKDRATGERKGFTYVKFNKTSEAARALEALNGKVIGNTNRHIKIIIASRRDQGSRREENEEERSQRLFVLIPKTMTEDELHDYFKQFGDIDNIAIIRDKETKENKGFAYVKYFKFSSAALAFEQCDKKYKAVFAEPRSNKRNSSNDYLDMNNSYDSFNVKSSSKILPLPDTPNEGYTKLSVIASLSLNQDQLWKLFDIVPGMDYCQLRTEGRYPSRGLGAQILQLVYLKQPFIDRTRSTDTTISLSQTPDIKQLAETIAQATSIIQAAGLSPDFLQNKLGLQINRKDETYCSVELPDIQPLLHVDDIVEARCFFVCSPHPPSSATLKDVFCRFGNLIEVYICPAKQKLRLRQVRKTGIGRKCNQDPARRRSHWNKAESVQSRGKRRPTKKNKIGSAFSRLISYNGLTLQYLTWTE
ncbi:RNA recognition motif [Popillia japonica]|uniref:RNA recognition motif n=1 Tax=Popillia japonica TaxID=7064 RepID=A0AAW1ITW4_POPJA